MTERVPLRPIDETLTPEGKKTAKAIRQQITHEADEFLRVVFQDRRCQELS